jgi:hypothetical protein
MFPARLLRVLDPQGSPAFLLKGLASSTAFSFYQQDNPTPHYPLFLLFSKEMSWHFLFSLSIWGIEGKLDFAPADLKPPWCWKLSG